MARKFAPGTGGAKLPPPSGPTPWTGQDAQIYNQIKNDPGQMTAWQKYRQQYPNRSLVGWAQRGKPGYKAPAAAGAPPGQGAGAGGGAAQSGAYQDPIYLAAVARLNFDEQQGVQAIDRQNTYEQGNYQSAIEQMLRSRSQGIRSDRQNAARRGALYSTSLDNTLSEGEANYQTERGNLDRSYNFGAGERAAARSALEQGLPLDVAAQAAQAAGRTSQGTLGEASTGLPPTPTIGAPATSSSNLSRSEWQRRYNAIALRHGANSAEANAFRKRNPMPK